MATRRRTTRRTTRRRSTATRRRRPKLATTLGSAAALSVLAFYTRANWPWRIGVTLVLVLAALAYWVWTRRGEIAEQAQAGPMPGSGADSEEESG